MVQGKTSWLVFCLKYECVYIQLYVQMYRFFSNIHCKDYPLPLNYLAFFVPIYVYTYFVLLMNVYSYLDTTDLVSFYSELGFVQTFSDLFFNILWSVDVVCIFTSILASYCQFLLPFPKIFWNYASCFD